MDCSRSTSGDHNCIEYCWIASWNHYLGLENRLRVGDSRKASGNYQRSFCWSIEISHQRNISRSREISCKRSDSWKGNNQRSENLDPSDQWSWSDKRNRGA